MLAEKRTNGLSLEKIVAPGIGTRAKKSPSAWGNKEKEWKGEKQRGPILSLSSVTVETECNKQKKLGWFPKKITRRLWRRRMGHYWPGRGRKNFDKIKVKMGKEKNVAGKQG